LQSIVVPAAYCGVVGYKPTFGRLPFDGINLAPSMDTVGFLAPSIADLHTAVSAVIPDWHDPVSSRSPVLGAPEPWGLPSLVAEGWRAHASHLEVFRGQGFDLPPTTMPWNDPDDLRDWGMRVGGLLYGEMALAHASWFDRFAHLYRPRTAEAVRRGQEITAERLRECREARADLAALIREHASRTGIDGWICPSTGRVAPIGFQDTGDSSMTGLWSYAGLPTLTLPVFDGSDGMPLGVQLVAPPGGDELLLGWAALVEAALAQDEPPGAR
jgi:Asp-tRNA(Asn)/Glu-tRNA(Gln) amidotransferase A subunit family amidase